jgi:hypothetical protein
MAAVKLTNLNDPLFGECVELSNGLAEVRVALDFGPRVVRYACAGMENVLFEDAAKTPLHHKFDEFDSQLALCGGHRVWISPEVVPRCYHPDDKRVAVVETENGARIEGAVEKHTQIQKTIAITMGPDTRNVRLVHTIINKGLWDVTLAPWCITMLAPGGVEIVPIPTTQTGLLPNRTFTLWPYTEMNDPRVYWGKSYISVVQDAGKKNAFKFGNNNEAGWAVYFNRGQAFYKFFEPEPDGYYPDGNCSFETYTNAAMLEMETLGEMTELEPGGFVTHEEEWELYPADAFDRTRARDEGYLEEMAKKYAEV